MSAPNGQAAALELRGVTKRFGPTIALEGVDLTLDVGQVHALLGENGAGKSTAMKIAYGLTDADAGSVRVFGQELGRHSVDVAIAAGLGMVHQHLSLVPTLTAAENLALGGHGPLNLSAAGNRLRELGDASGLRVEPTAVVSELSLVEQQRLEILKALARDARVLILDEPTAVLAPSESEELLGWLRAFANRGGSVVLVTHKLREAMSIADAVTVLRQGRVVATVSASTTSEAQLARAMFPDGEDQRGPSPTEKGERVVKLVDAAIAGARGITLRNASLELHRGEIVGIAGIEGSGHRDLLRALSGHALPVRGSVELPERIALIPADRGRDAIIAEFSLTENVALHGLSRARGLMPWTTIAERTRALIGEFGITARSPDVAIRSLSGGNQQRLVVARELEHEVDLLVADNPTRGLDLRASGFVHEQLRKSAARGAAVVVHSSDLDELLSLASRVLVVFGGAVTEVERVQLAVSRAMVGAAA